MKLLVTQIIQNSQEQRRLQSQQTADQPSPLKPQNMKKLTKSSSSGRKPNTPISTPRSTSFSRKCDEEKGMDGMSVGRKPFVALVSEDNWPATPTKMAAVEVEESGVPGTMQMADQNVQEVEYSFEERRAGFVLSSAHMNCVQK